METAPQAVTLGASILVLITMMGTLVLLRFHAKNASGRSRKSRVAGEQGQDFYERLIALELMSLREQFEAEDRSERDRAGASIDLTAGSEQDASVTIDLTADSDEQRREPLESEPVQSETKSPGSPI